MSGCKKGVKNNQIFTPQRKTNEKTNRLIGWFSLLLAFLVLPCQYPEWDLNPHSCNSQGILSPSCLPIPPSGQPWFCGAKIIAIFYSAKNISNFLFQQVVDARLLLLSKSQIYPVRAASNH